jgi:hypothetical protein
MANGLVAELREHGLLTSLIEGSAGITAGGADLQVWPRELERSETATGHLMRRLGAFVHDGLPVTLSIRELGPDDAADRPEPAFPPGAVAGVFVDFPHPAWRWPAIRDHG